MRGIEVEITNQHEQIIDILKISNQSNMKAGSNRIKLTFTILLIDRNKNFKTDPLKVILQIVTT